MRLLFVTSSPKKHLAIVWMMAILFLLLLYGLGGMFEVPLGLYAFVLVIAILVSVFAALYAKTITLELKENEILFTRGIFVRHTTTINYNRIDNVKKIQSIFDMLLGLGTLEIDTPGKIEKEIFVRNLEMSDILKVYNILVEKMKGKYDFYKTRES
ncbi:MAG: PH domain-containing protein [Candidatus Anstonellales archaeon]